MATDEELLVRDVLNAQWVSGNVQTPTFYYDDTVKVHDFRNLDAVKIYTLDSIPEPKGLGYISRKTDVHMTIDLRSRDRSRMMSMRDEVKRIVEANRKTMSGYDIFRVTSDKKVASYFNYHQYAIEVLLRKHITQI